MFQNHNLNVLIQCFKCLKGLNVLILWFKCSNTVIWMFSHYHWNVLILWFKWFKRSNTMILLALFSTYFAISSCWNIREKKRTWVDHIVQRAENRLTESRLGYFTSYGKPTIRIWTEQNRCHGWRGGREYNMDLVWSRQW